MKFDKLHAMIPYAVGGKQKILTMHPYNAITLALPGRHSDQTTPRGGDFVVMVDDDGMDWTRHQFTHTDLFQDLQAKRDSGVLGLKNAEDLMRLYRDVIKGLSPCEGLGTIPEWEGTLHPQTFLFAVQCLAVAEHRRYAQHEAKLGGKFLPFRFASGIVEGLWTATDAAERQRRGRPGVEWLERDHGVPSLTKELITGSGKYDS